MYPIGQNVLCTLRTWSKLQSTMTSSLQWPVCCEKAGRLTTFSQELSQKVLRHYNRNVMDIVVCSITNN